MGNRYRFKGLQRYLMPTRALQLNGHLTLSLDFAAQSYAIGDRPIEDVQRLLTMKRDSPKWVYNSSGQLVEVPANQPAYQHDPVTGEPKGLLIEESRTNLLFPSASFASWTGGAGVSDSGDAFIAGDTWKKLTTTPNGAGSDKANHRKKKYEYTAGITYTFSVFVKPAELDVASLRLPSNFGSFFGASVNISSGDVVETIGHITNDDILWEPMSDGSARVSITGVCQTSGRGQTRIYVGELSKTLFDGTSGILTAGAQLEEGSSPSSYIPTVDSPVTRAADTVYRELGDEFNPRAGTYTIRAAVPTGETVATLGSVSVTSTSDEMTTYTLSYSSDPGATELVLGNGLFDSIDYAPG